MWLCWLSILIVPCTRSSVVQFLLGALAQVVGWIPSRGHTRDSQSVFFSLSVSLPLYLKKSMKTYFYKERIPDKLFSLCHLKTHQEDYYVQSRKMALTGTQPCWYSELRFPSFQNCENKISVI